MINVKYFFEVVEDTEGAEIAAGRTTPETKRIGPNPLWPMTAYNSECLTPPGTI